MGEKTTWQEIYHQVAETALQGMAIVQDGRFRYVNAAFCELVGKESEVLLQYSPQDIATLLHPDDLPAALKHLAMQNGKRVAQERMYVRVCPSPGEVRHLLLLSSIVPYDERPAQQLVCIDIGHQIEAERSLKERIAWMETIFDAAPLGIIVIQRERLTFVNRHAGAILGYAQQELIEQPAKVLCPNEGECVFGAQGFPLTNAPLKTRLQHKDGHTISAMLQMAPLSIERPSAGTVFLITNLTDQENQQKSLEKSQQQYRTLFENSPVALWVEDFSAVRRYIDGLRAQGIQDFRAYFLAHPEAVAACVSLVRLVDINQATVDLYAAPNKATLLRDLAQTFTQESLDVFRDELVALCNGATSHHAEAITRRLDGEKIYHTVEFNLGPDSEQTWEYVIVSMSDLTARWRAEQNLREQAERTPKLLSGLMDGFALMTPQGDIRETNPAFCHMTGYCTEDLKHLNIADIESDLLPDAMQERLTAILGQGGMRFETTYRRQNGSTFAVDVSTTIVHEAGEARIAAFVRDISAQKHAQNLTERMHTALVDMSASLGSDVLLERLLMHANEILPYDDATIYLKDAGGYRPAAHADSLRTCQEDESLLQFLSTHLSPPSRLSGVPEEEILYTDTQIGTLMIAQGKIIGALVMQRNPPGRYEVQDTLVAATFARQAALVLQNNTLYTQSLARANTLQEHAAERTAELNERIQEIEHLNHALTNLLEDVQAINQHLQKAMARIQAANKELDFFTYAVAHDLRAPLRAIQGYANLLQEGAMENLNAEGKVYMTRIYETTRHLDLLIQDLLAYSRLTSAEITLHPVALDDVLDELLMQYRPVIEEQRADIQVTRPLPVVAGNTAVLQQIIGNLLSNALKFVPAECAPQVRIWAEKHLDGYRIWIADNGLGIPAEQTERIFQIFERLHGEETYPGTGIGLAIVRRGVERLNGSVGVESTEGAGSQFWVYLPAG
ncbi:MAG: hypothetical protein Fur0018_11670 [Anaerolineales bacterium]